MMMVFLVLLGIEGLSYMLNDENKKRLLKRHTLFSDTTFVIRENS